MLVGESQQALKLSLQVTDVILIGGLDVTLQLVKSTFML